jgi:hypothetical protein
MISIKNTLFALISITLLAGCSSFTTNPDLGGEAKYPTGAGKEETPGGQNDIYSKPDSIFGKGGISLFGSKNKAADASAIGVNSYLWRAALDTVSFMPLSSADPFGGVILTDWYTPQATPNERLKLNVFILDRQLRSDGIQVKVFRQVRGTKGGAWKDTEVTPATARQLEDTILTRARQLRVAEMNGDK